MVKLEDEFYGEADKLMEAALADLKGTREKLLVSELVSKPTLNNLDLKVIMLSLFTDGLSTVRSPFGIWSKEYSDSANANI